MGWLDSPLVQREYVQPATGGGASAGNWVADLVARVGVPSGGHWLSLGCGSADQELYCLEQGFCARLTGYDISAESIAQAEAKARQRGVEGARFLVQDFQDLRLPRRAFSAVVMSMSLHHVAELHRVLRQVRSCLQPGGWLLVNEYIGPSQFQFDEGLLRLVEDLLAALPERLRYDYLNGVTKSRYVKHSRAHWFAVDPSEAICSEHIEGALRRFFRVAVQANYGGPVLALLLENIVGNFSPEREDDVAILRTLMATERALIREDVLADHFAVFAARPRRTPWVFLSWLLELADRLRVASWRRLG